MDSAPFISEEHTYLPMRYVGEALGETVRWDKDNRIALFGDYPRIQDVKGIKYTVSDGYSLTIPEHLSDRIVCKNVPYGIALYEKTNYNSHTGYDGWLGSFSVSVKPEYETRHLILGKYGGQYLSFNFVSDVNYDINSKDLTKAYMDAENGINEILETIEIAE